MSSETFTERQQNKLLCMMHSSAAAASMGVKYIQPNYWNCKKVKLKVTATFLPFYLLCSLRT